MNISDSTFSTFAFYGALTAAAIAGCLGLLWLNEVNMRRLERNQSDIETMAYKVVDLLEQSAADATSAETPEKNPKKINE